MSLIGEIARAVVAALSVEVRGIIRRATRPKAPSAPVQPLSFKDVAHIEAQRNSAARPFPPPRKLRPSK